MTAFAALILAIAVAPKVEGFGVAVVASRPALTVFASAAVPDVRVERSGSDVTVLLAGAVFGSAFGGTDRLSWTMPEGPGAIQIEQRPGGVALRMNLPTDSPLDVLRQGKVVALVFGPRGSAPLTAASPPAPPKPASPPPGPVAEARPVASPSPPTPAPAPTPAAPAQVAPGPSPSPPAVPRRAPEKARAPEKPKEEKAQVLTVRTTMVDTRPALTVLFSRPLAEVSVERVGTEVVVALGAEMAEGIPAPPAVPPLEAIGIERAAGGVTLHVRVAPDVPFQVRRGETLLTVLFGEETQAPARAAAPGDSRQVPTTDLYGRLFPTGGGASAPPPEATGGSEVQAHDKGTLTFGPLALRPALSASYVNADTAITDTPQPVHDEYLQVQPALWADLSLRSALLSLSYQPSFRLFSGYSEVEAPFQLFTAGLSLPIGSRVSVAVNERFSQGTLETREVDPGNEYFFDLSRYTRNAVNGSVDIETGSRLGLNFGGGWDHVTFTPNDPGEGFVPYDIYVARAGAFYEITPKLRASLTYDYGRVPPSDARPLVESTANSVSASFNGQISDVLNASLSVGYLDQSSPEGGGTGQSFSGLIMSGSLQREMRANTFVGLTLNRATQVSNFEQNAFYVTTGGILNVTAPLPWEIVVRGAVGLQSNSYQLPASEIGEPRQDSIFGWGIGLGRPIRRLGFVRADYRRDRRYSNLPGYDITSDGLIIQLGFGLFGSSVSTGR